jgi:hypothetical protein
MSALETVLNEALLLGYHVTISPSAAWNVDSKNIRVQIVFDFDKTTGRGKIAEQFISKAEYIPDCIAALVGRIRTGKLGRGPNA